MAKAPESVGVLGPDVVIIIYRESDRIDVEGPTIVLFDGAEQAACQRLSCKVDHSHHGDPVRSVAMPRRVSTSASAGVMATPASQ